MTTSRPRLESLEDRALPSVSASIVGTSLVISGDGNGNVINVAHLGLPNSGNVRGRIDGESLNVLTGKQLRFTQITNVNIFARGGDDTVTFTLPFGLGMPLVPPPTVNLYADLGSGDDTYTGNLGRFIFFGSRLNQTVTGYGGDDTISSAFSGRLGGVINSSFDGGRGSNLIRTDVAEDNLSAGVVNTYVNARGDDAVVFNLFEFSSSGTLHNFQLNANDNDVTLYWAVVHRPHLTRSFLNADDLTVVVISEAQTGRGPFFP
jgi:hypothetical protein